MLIAGAPRRQEVAREDLHVAGEHDQVDLAEQLEHAPLGLGLGRRLDRHVVEGDADRVDLARGSGWLEITATISPPRSPRQRQSRSRGSGPRARP